MSFMKYKGDFLLLTEAGFIAINQADEDSALKLFRAAELLDPKNTLPRIGYGYLHLHKLELPQAVRRFEEVLKEEPHNEMAKALLGISMSFSPKMLNEGEKILEESSHSKDPEIKKLGKIAIDFVDQFVKTPARPTEKRKK